MTRRRKNKSFYLLKYTAENDTVIITSPFNWLSSEVQRFLCIEIRQHRRYGCERGPFKQLCANAECVTY